MQSKKRKTSKWEKLGLPLKKRSFRVGNSTISSRRAWGQKGGG